jgi:hypothetical protein
MKNHTVYTAILICKWSIRCLSVISDSEII